MTSILRQIVAGPRAPHAEAGLDLCYVTDRIIATSGPSGTYPQRAYRNPLSSLVKFLDYKHKEDWAIWEFRAEGTGYPDSEVYGRVWHYPWPDHHPPPFALIPNIMASMRNWLHEKEERVVVVHCKAGKGRSGTVSCSYLVSEEGWTVEDAIARFTERRMRPGFGAGVSIPSQLRWLTYVDRWGKHGGKIYVERQVEILGVKLFGLRDGVKITVEGFVDDGKTIKDFHAFDNKEREIVRGSIKENTGLAGVVAEVMGRSNSVKKSHSPKASPTTQSIHKSSSASTSKTNLSKADSQDDEQLGGDAIYTPSKRVILPTNDINIDFERRSTAAYGLTMVTAVAHVWFNSYFEGNGPEQDGKADHSGVFSLDWDALDGIKGSSRKGTRAFDRFEVEWKVYEASPEVVIHEPQEGEEVKQAAPADWKGHQADEGHQKDLGIRAKSPRGSHEHSKHGEESKSGKNIVSASAAHHPEHGTKAHGQSGEEHIKKPGVKDRVRDKMEDKANKKESETAARETGFPTAEDLGMEESKSSILPSTTAVPAEDSSHIRSPDSSVSTQSMVSTSDLPDGKPEAEMKTTKEHHLGHLRRKK